MVKNKTYLASFVLFIAVVVGLTLFSGSKVNAATFIVDSVGDASDMVSGDGICEATGAVCTLRAAIQESNSLDGDDVINFGIAGPGPYQITPGSSLPVITEALSIDGTTQSGSVCEDLVPGTLPSSENAAHTIMIHISGTSSPSSAGLGIEPTDGETGSVQISGIAIGGFTSGYGIEKNDSGDADDFSVDLDCVYIGTDTSGLTADSNGTGMYSQNSAVTIARSVVSGNGNSGLHVYDTNLTIDNSIFGLGSDGQTVLPNQDNGVFASGGTLAINYNIFAGNDENGMMTQNIYGLVFSGNFVGIDKSGDPAGNGRSGLEVLGGRNIQINNSGGRNVFSANSRDGLHLHNDCSGGGSLSSVQVRGNYIGTNHQGNVATGYGNQLSGIRVNEHTGECGTVAYIQIGGALSSDLNIIAGNSGNGILMYQSPSQDVREVTIIRNSIHSNGSIGIDLASDSNDDGEADGDLGLNVLNSFLITYPTQRANYFLNSLVIRNYTQENNKLTVRYDYQTKAIQESFPAILEDDVVGYRLDFYISDSRTNIQGKTHVGSFIIDGSETNASHTFDFVGNIPAGGTVTATATILWRIIPEDVCDERAGTGPPYYIFDPNCGIT